MRLFLVDYENVNSSGLAGIGKVSPQDRLILFYSHAANTLSFEIMDEMLAANVMPERVCLAQSGKNALDFQLVTFLGYLIAKENAEEYFIISRDAGYQAAISFCREYLGVRVQLKPSLQAAIATRKVEGTSAKKNASPPTPAASPKTKQEKSASVSLRRRATVIQVQPVGSATPPPVPQAASHSEQLEQIRKLIPPSTSSDIAAKLLKCLQKSHSKVEFHNALQKQFENDKVKQYYRCLKPCFPNYLTEEG